jgi:hypothetical protein
MALYVPQEILSLIIQHVVREDDGHKLTPYTLVNKSWQAAFEREIYGSIVVLSPSDVSTIMISPTESREKRGLSFARLDEITSGPQYWRKMRRTYIQRILYRVAVPYWINSHRTGYSETGIWDSPWRRENNQAFSKGIRSLFEYLSMWTAQDIALDIALQAEMGYFVEDRHFEDWEEYTDEDIHAGHNEADTHYVETEFDTFVPPYNADFLPDWHLPKAECVTSLNFSKFDLVADPPSGYTPFSENGILVPAVVQIASACGTLRKIKLDGEYETSYLSHVERMHVRDATAAALTQLPLSIQHVEFIGDWPGHSWGYDGPLKDPTFHRLDTLSMAFRNVSTRLTSLHIKEEAIFPELLCLDGTPGLMGDIHWPHLETLHLEAASSFAAFESMERYKNGGTHLTRHERYIEDLFESLGYATQRMPRLKNAFVKSQAYYHSYPDNLTLSFQGGKWMFSIMADECCTYEPSSRVLQAWKVSRENLQLRSGRAEGLAPEGYPVKYWEATYTSWPLL